MRQLTCVKKTERMEKISKLPMRQLTIGRILQFPRIFSKLPMRQLTDVLQKDRFVDISKLPMRQLTMRERKKNPTARTLIHLSPTLTQIYSCFEIY